MKEYYTTYETVKLVHKDAKVSPCIFWGVFAHPHGRNYCFPLSLNKNVLKLFAGISFYKSRDKKVQMRVLPKVQHTFPDYGSCKDVCIYLHISEK